MLPGEFGKCLLQGFNPGRSITAPAGWRNQNGAPISGLTKCLSKLTRSCFMSGEYTIYAPKLKFLSYLLSLSQVLNF